VVRAYTVGALVLASCAVSLPASASAQSPRFGEAGVTSLALDATFAYQHRRPPEPSALELELAPEVLFFVSEGLAFGGAISFGYVASEPSDAQALGGHLIAAYHGWLGSRFGLLPKASFGFVHGQAEVQQLVVDPIQLSVGSEGATRSTNTLELALAILMLYHPVPNAFLGAGPSLDFSSFLLDEIQNPRRNWQLAFALRTLLGAWF